MNIGEFVRTKRKERGISQKQLAEYAEVSFSLINRIENGDMHLRLSTLNQVLEVFGHEVGPVPQNKEIDLSGEMLNES
ncbi:MAG: helix-turn-helix transcriptional regulator [Bdellovibrionales bacterium]|nr:helix-turn-helix transcriptional regulator [Bdellovibrionales bacterium]